MGKIITVAMLAVFGLGCGPQAGNADDGDDLPGVLEYEYAYARIYRSDRRVDIVLVEEDGERTECGMLTDRGYDELQSTLDALDPTIDYGYDPDVQDCSRPMAWVYVKGFEHSPFECSWMCCDPDLLYAAFIYSVVLSNLDGIAPSLNGEPYYALAPDEPCP